jgi:hypothetical protein
MRTVIMFCVLLAAAASHAQSPRFDDLAPKKPAAKAAKPAPEGLLEVQEPAPCAGYPAELKGPCFDAYRADFEHSVWALQYRQRAYEAHHQYTMWVFILVCALVVLGMYLSWREFNLDERRRLRGKTRNPTEKGEVGAGAGDPGGGGGAPTSSLDLTATGLKVTSPVLGVIILVVSMGFFYLYLKTVYPIQESAAIAQPQANPAPPPATK